MSSKKSKRVIVAAKACNSGLCSSSRGVAGVGRARRQIVADQLHSAAIHLLRRVRKDDTRISISPARLSALSVLVFAGPKSLGNLAQAEQVSAPTMSKIVQGLEVDGLVKRKADQRDLRAIQLSATYKGKSTLQRARKLRIDSLAELLQSASKNDLTILNQAAQIIEQALSR